MNKNETIKIEIDALKMRLEYLEQEIIKTDKSNKLEPYDYDHTEHYWIGVDGDVEKGTTLADSTRNACTKKGAEILAKQHRWQVLIQSLRDSLGCGDYSFTDGGINYYIYYQHFYHKWNTCSGARCEHVEQFYFPTKEMAEQVVDYLNQNYKDGFK